MTKGFNFERAEKQSLTDNEINMAVRTQQEPSRQKLQKIIDQVVQHKPTALEFAQNLEMVGINVRANLASTGKLNGFSFELDGVPFKGQDLGAAYKWSSLQKRGVTYEQERDRLGLERYKTTIDARRTSPEASEQLKFYSKHIGYTSGSIGESASPLTAGFGTQQRDQENSRRLRETVASTEIEFGQTIGKSRAGDIEAIRHENERGGENFGRPQTSSIEFENSGKGYSGFWEQIEINNSGSEIGSKTGSMEENRTHDHLRVDRGVPNDVHKVLLQRSVPVGRREMGDSIHEGFDKEIDNERVSGNKTNRRSTSEIDPEDYLENLWKTIQEEIKEKIKEQKKQEQTIGMSHGRSM